MVSQHWNTPEWILDAVRKTFRGPIDLDPCDNEFSVTKPTVSFRLPDTDGLKANWGEVSHRIGKRINVFCNPPFGRSEDGTSVADWVKKCREQMTYPTINSIILLLPASTETTFWHEHIWPTATAIAFLQGRVSFLLNGKMGGASTKGTALVYWGLTGYDTDFFHSFSPHGKVVRVC
jgi:site-specific DNA-methyltransferase (adenine-specific)